MSKQQQRDAVKEEYDKIRDPAWKIYQSKLEQIEAQ